MSVAFRNITTQSSRPRARIRCLAAAHPRALARQRAMKLFAVRHGKTEWNLEGREIGQLDSPLTVHGLFQAAALARRLSSLRVDLVYSSDLGRALRTAEVIATTGAWKRGMTSAT